MSTLYPANPNAVIASRADRLEPSDSNTRRDLLLERMAMFRNGLQDFPGQFLVAGFHGQIAQGHNANHMHAGVENDEPAYLLVLHDPCRIAHELILKTIKETGRHGVTDAVGSRVVSFRNRPDGNIAIGEHSRQSVLIG